MLKLDIQRFAATCSISCTQVGISETNNTTTERITFSVTRTSGSTHWDTAKTVTFTVDGKTYTSTLALKSNQSSNSCYVDVTVTHNDDGSKSISYSASITTGTSAGTLTASGSKELTKIPRKTACPNLSGDIESSYTIPLNPASSGFTHSVYVSFGTLTGYINASGALQSGEYKFSNTNVPFTIPSSFYNQFSGKSGTGSLKVKTYNGSTLIGETTGTLTANCLESRCRPSISGSAIDSNNTTKALTGNQNKLVKYFSNATLNLTIKAATSSGDTKSTITSQSVDGTTFSGTSVTLNKVSKKDFTVTVTNSRGFSTSQVISASGGLVNYFPPSITIDANRYPDQTSSNVRLTYKGTFFNASFGSVANAITMKWYWRLSTSSSWTLGGTVTPSLNGNTINQATIDCGNNFNYLNSYRFKLEIVDKLTSEGTKEDDVTVGFPMVHMTKNGTQFFVPIYDKDGNLVIGTVTDVLLSNSMQCALSTYKEATLSKNYTDYDIIFCRISASNNPEGTWAVILPKIGILQERAFLHSLTEYNASVTIILKENNKITARLSEVKGWGNNDIYLQKVIGIKI